MSDSLEEIKGQLDAVSLLCSSLAARLSPNICSVILESMHEIHKKIGSNQPVSPYEHGFLGLEKFLLESLKTVSDADKIAELSGDEPHN